MVDELDLRTFTPHPQRDAVLGEVHARPFTRLVSPFSVIHLAFLAQGEAATSDRCRFIDCCLERNLPPPEQSAKLHQIVIGPGTLRWEQHSEFTTFTWIWSNTVRSLIRALRQTGHLLVAIRLEATCRASECRCARRRTGAHLRERAVAS
ncbi:DUF3422 family protein [Bradyrhizobium sp. CCBAU 11357]|uniref:DUF3422 family protein n=1 Tax=Bradyrhizobium sp. CCBAU 11357 TaxID=1630808 RepID=UPI002302DAC0|nr:DUF3422 family protein [Bradyrhizobium sp. CCBAU 11357]